MKDESNKLDDLIRKKMSELGTDYRPEAWDRLNDHLDAMEGTSNSLDDIVRDKMADLAPIYRPETWEVLQERLNTIEGAPDQLDHIIRDKVADLAPTYQPNTWDALNERLEGLAEGSAAGAEMQPMDEAIYEQMHSLEKPYDPTHWPLLLKKLEANAFVGKQIIRYKAMELSLLALLLITFVRMPLGTEKQVPLPLRVYPQERPQAVNTPNDNTQDKTIAIHTPEEEKTQESTQGNNDQQAAENQVNSKSLEPGQQPIREIGNLKDQLVATKQSDASDLLKSNMPITIPDLEFIPANRRQLTTPAPKVDLSSFLKTDIQIDEPLVIAINPTANALGVLSYLPTTMMQPFCQTCIGKLNRTALSAKPETYFRIGFQAGPDYNRVVTPTTIINGKQYRADRYSLGYSGGLTFGMERGRWEIETGLIYSNKSYFSLPVVVLDGSVQGGFFGDGTKQFDLDVFQVPLNFRYNFFRKKRWRVYALAGISLHVTTQSNYYLANPADFETNNYRPQPISPGQTNPGANVPTVKSKFDNFTKGWLEGGAFSKNSYLSGNIGVGAEYFITDYWSLYAQPTYGHSLIYLYDGLGPYYDRIHTNSLSFGIKVRLK